MPDSCDRIRLRSSEKFGLNQVHICVPSLSTIFVQECSSESRVDIGVRTSLPVGLQTDAQVSASPAATGFMLRSRSALQKQHRNTLFISEMSPPGQACSLLNALWLRPPHQQVGPVLRAEQASGHARSFTPFSYVLLQYVEGRETGPGRAPLPRRFH